MASLLYLYVYVMIFLTMPLVIPKRSRGSAGEGLAVAEQQDAIKESTDENLRLCHNVDIRNNLNRLRWIENCTVITGYLQLVLIEKVTTEDFQNYNLTQLREVTGFLLFFHVYNLVSLRELFPNLMVIRGRTLIGNYALIFYDMPNMTEIGLKNLLAIEHGFVYVQHCPKLCYTDTIDWPSITHRANVSLNLNRFDKPDKSAMCNNNRTDICRGCKRPFCWSSLSCQRFHTGFDFTGTIKCHDQCLGGCATTKDTGCRVCRGPKEGVRCVEKCSEGKVLYDESLRCISKQTCINRGGLLFQGSCLKECPAGYSATDVDQLDADFSNHTCYPCYHRCPKICEGSEIMYLVDAERLQGCTIINGTLQIRMTEDHPQLVDELKRSLGEIEEIMGYLKVYRSKTLPSLEFLEGLSTIHGLELGHGNYSLMVYENTNLQKLWTYEIFRPLRLITGSMYFVYNPLLCVSQIELLKKLTDYNDTNDLINVDSNGFMQSCNVVSITVKAEVHSSRSVTIYWTRFQKTVNQTLLGYIIFFTPSDQQRSPYDGRDFCSEYSWQSKLVLMKETSTHKDFLSHKLTGLKPLTRYAYYVRTYLTDNFHNVTERKIGQSVVHYFVTMIARPTPPLKVFTTKKTDSSITFSWKILKSEVNLVKRYRVEVFIQPDDRKLLDQRNYCLYPREADKEPEMVDECSAEMCCSDDSILLDVPEFSDPDNDLFSRKKRSISSSYGNIVNVQSMDDFHSRMYDTFLNILQSAEYSPENHHRTKRETATFVNRISLYEFTGVTEFTVTNLRPYHYYTFQLFACSSTNLSFCSAYSIYSDRTYPSLVLPAMELTVIKQTPEEYLEPNSIAIVFQEPEAINGAVVAFNVEIAALYSETPFARRTCITQQDHEQAGHQYRFRNLSVGEYKVRAQVVSLAGPESFSDWYFAKVEQLVVEAQPVENHSVRNGFITFGVLFSLTVGMIGCYVLYRRFKKHRDDKELLIENDGNEDGFVDCDLR